MDIVLQRVTIPMKSHCLLLDAAKGQGLPHEASIPVNHTANAPGDSATPHIFNIETILRPVLLKREH